MKNIKFLLVGLVFGIILTKSEVISWFRIYEMFRFESFHMYGVIGSAVVLGMLSVWLIKKFEIHDFSGHPIHIQSKRKAVWPPLLGGTTFGLGWALTGACPGPIYILIGNGFLTFSVVWASAVLGTFIYGTVFHKLPQN